MVAPLKMAASSASLPPCVVCGDSMRLTKAVMYRIYSPVSNHCRRSGLLPSSLQSSTDPLLTNVSPYLRPSPSPSSLVANNPLDLLLLSIRN